MNMSLWMDQTRHLQLRCDPLSPLLFALYINDFAEDIPKDFGVKLLGSPRCVSFIFYADDLVLVSDDPTQLNRMMEILQGYAARNGLQVNEAKSEIVVFSKSHAATCNDIIKYKGTILKVSGCFKYLGLEFDHHAATFGSHSDEQWSKKLLIATSSLISKVKSHGITNRIDLLLQLYQVYALPLGRYAPQVWSPELLRPSAVYDSSNEPRHL